MFKLTSNLLAGVLIATLLLSACKKEEDKKTSTQVAAKVDSTEISMHQINQVMSSAKNVTPENASAIRQQVLEKLIDQQILVDKAAKDNLDRTPQVMMAIEAAKKDIIARAFLQKMVANDVKVTDQEVRGYFDEHPGLFSKRRIYNLQDLGFESNEQLFIEVNAELEKHKSIQEIADWLKAKDIKFSAGAYTRPAEQIPLEILPKLQDVKDGETVALKVQNAIHVIKIVKSQSAPIELAAATPFIKNYFLNTRGKEIVDAQMKKFRSEAKIEYVGDFATIKSDGQANPQIVKPVDQSKPLKDMSSKKYNADEGIAGLK